MVAPLLFTFLYFTMYSDTLPFLLGISVLFVWMIVMLLLSKKYFKGVMQRTESGIVISIDYYRIVGFLFLLVMNGRVLENDASELILKIIVSCLVVVYFLVIRNWTMNHRERKIYLAAAIVLCLYPYQVHSEWFSDSGCFGSRGPHHTIVFYRNHFIKKNHKSWKYKHKSLKSFLFPFCLVF